MSGSASAVSTTWCLLFLSGAVRGRTIVLKNGPNIVGSSGECEIMLPGADILPRHMVFNVGSIAVSIQKLGTAGVRLNGEELGNQRRTVVPGDIVSVDGVDFQLDKTVPVAESTDHLFEWGHTEQPSLEAGEVSAPAVAVQPRRRARWVAGAVIGVAVGVGVWAIAASGLGSADGVFKNSSRRGLADIEKILKDFPEVEVVALGGVDSKLSVRGYVESEARKKTLEQVLKPHAGHVSVNVHTAEEMIDQARRFVADPSLAITYAGYGRIMVSGSTDNIEVRKKIQRLTEDLHPAVLVSDKVDYRTPQVDALTALRHQWDAWQNILPDRMVGITEDASGMRYIQLSNGNRYYEGSRLKSGAELKEIAASGLVVIPAAAPKKPGEVQKPQNTYATPDPYVSPDFAAKRMGQAAE